jgi:CubicO group peptidase (beta-lactamase class C family)
MLLWISDGPATEFLARPLEMKETPKSHRDIAQFIQHGHQWLCRVGWVDQGPAPMTRFIQPNTWNAMWQDTPHRGVKATAHGWRVFARVTHKSLAPRRPVTSVIRRHAQVYLDAAEFGW